MPDFHHVVDDFGAPVNGTSNATTEIQAAINQSLIDNAPVVFPPGVTFKVTALTADIVKGYSGFTMVSPGSQTILSKFDSSTTPILRIRGRNVGNTTGEIRNWRGRLNNIRFAGNNLSSQVNLELRDVADGGLFGVVSNEAGIGLNALGFLNSHVQHCEFRNNVTGVILDNSNDTGAGVWSNRLKMVSCKFRGNTAWGLHVKRSALLNVDTCEFNQNGTTQDLSTGCMRMDETLGESGTGHNGHSPIHIVSTWFENNFGRGIYGFGNEAGSNASRIKLDTLIMAAQEIISGNRNYVYLDRWQSIISENVFGHLSGATAALFEYNATAGTHFIETIPTPTTI